eukprot:CAMPEP_0183723118 /NCGR_PEP_ID=MMETSP0737-20130205/14825_1 /TAXON_ID=385413 /ORGANISM="Thalassiosira miniscula, Strain CCMP1093" /LENGTH=529 /DNA_ID=CAMNT_0025953371 /DNA_START=27 /DNA_END=1616 /DNA_ORIENTATION=-
MADNNVVEETEEDAFLLRKRKMERVGIVTKGYNYVKRPETLTTEDTATRRTARRFNDEWSGYRNLALEKIFDEDLRDRYRKDWWSASSFTQQEDTNNKRSYYSDDGHDEAIRRVFQLVVSHPDLTVLDLFAICETYVKNVPLSLLNAPMEPLSGQERLAKINAIASNVINKVLPELRGDVKPPSAYFKSFLEASNYVDFVTQQFQNAHTMASEGRFSSLGDVIRLFYILPSNTLLSIIHHFFVQSFWEIEDAQLYSFAGDCEHVPMMVLWCKLGLISSYPPYNNWYSDEDLIAKSGSPYYNQLWDGYQEEAWERFLEPAVREKCQNARSKSECFFRHLPRDPSSDQESDSDSDDDDSKHLIRRLVLFLESHNDIRLRDFLALCGTRVRNVPNLDATITPFPTEEERMDTVRAIAIHALSKHLEELRHSNENDYIRKVLPDGTEIKTTMAEQDTIILNNAMAGELNNLDPVFLELADSLQGAFLHFFAEAYWNNPDASLYSKEGEIEGIPMMAIFVRLGLATTVPLDTLG